jgi:hypothetical protein
MRSIVTGICLAALVLVGVAGCLGKKDEANGTAATRPMPASGGFEKLESRPLDLPRIHLHARSIREHGLAGRCVEGPRVTVNAVVLPNIPGVAAPGPVGAREQHGPVYAALPEGARRIVFLSLLPTLGDSSWRVATTLWISRPSYDGPLLVRGGRLDRRGTIGFGEELPLRTAFRLPAGGWPRTGIGPRKGGTALRAGWRVTSVPTPIPAPGCYAFQIDGLGFSYALAFGVQSR